MVRWFRSGLIVPTGKYEADRLLNLGRNYYSLDIPVTYTYFNPKSGIDISLTAGLMVNWRNPDTDYRTGNEFHVDWLVGNVEQSAQGNASISI